MRRRTAIAAVGLLSALGGCATLTGNTDQMVLVQTIQDNRELYGAGCILSNDVGKWFVTTPGRITIRKSQAPLKVDCRKTGSPAVVTDNAIAPKLNGSVWGNVILTLGVGYFVDRNTGAGFDYPSTLTIIMQDPARLVPPPAPVAARPAAAPAEATPQPVVQPRVMPSPVPDPVVY
ncbi:MULTISPECIES: hypothetical protein [unclassified Janthinobacterium]|uniref:hypothetical protein n=1 Tax=unclassified Janthinobacterium TaxID=2610881 RepID=UPI001622B86C|nr:MULTISPECIES: hypothetical protein [unclassified Janthinobacterium]MBB5609784.1 hypothetical protein [Janthinobacterium sp. S3T4]MBB5614956.1 hypothetical protein [Janthinobacterium sp. S3M3]